MRPSAIIQMRPTLQALMRPTPLAMMRPSPLALMRPTSLLLTATKPPPTNAAYYYAGRGPNHPQPWPPLVWLLGWTGARIYPTNMWALYDKLVYAVLIVGYGVWELQAWLIEQPKFRNSPDNPYREWQDARDAKLAGVIAH